MINMITILILILKTSINKKSITKYIANVEGDRILS
jgi:hypothetical protein